MGLGLGLGFGGGTGGVAAAFNPSSLALTGWFRASYGGAPWDGSASAGSSAGKSMTSPGAPPSVGAAINGYTPADFNGTTQYLRDIVDICSDFISTTAYRVVMLIEPGSLAADSGVPYNDAGLFVETGGNWGVHINATDVGVYHYDGAYKVATKAVVAGKMLVDVRFSGTTLTVAVNGTDGTPVAAGTLGAIATDLRMGANYSAGVKYPGTIIEAFMAQSELAATTPSMVKAYVNARYALAL